MKLLYITNGITGSGGLERVLAVKTALLVENFDYEIHILSLNENGKETFFKFSNKIKRHSVETSSNKLQYFLKYKNGIQKIVDEVKPDVISVCDDALKGFFLPLLLKNKSKIIYERHVSKLIAGRENNGFFKNLSIKATWLLMDRLAKNFSKFVVLTESNKNEWRSLNNVQVIPDPLSFYPKESSILEQKTVICVGKLSYQKGQDLLVKAWEKVWHKHPDWRLELYGYTDSKFLNIEELEKTNIFYFPAEKDIMQKYLQSSIYVMSSRFEGFGMVLIEAMACGLPCVSFDCNYGPSDIISDKNDGFLVENGNIVELAEKLNILIENDFLRKQMGEKAKVNVKRFEPSSILQDWDMLFKSYSKDK